jgi:DNA-binding NarL/FixJ family response regulator
MGVAGMNGKTSLLVIAHKSRFRDGLTGLLNEQPDMTSRAVDPDRSAAERAVLELRPHLILLDSCLGASYCRRLRRVPQAADSPRVIVIGLAGGQEAVIQFVEAGCSGLILKDTATDRVLTTIRSVRGGASFLPTSLTETIFSHVARGAAGRGTDYIRDAVVLTQREQEVTGLIAEGLSNKEISGRLHIAVHTVKSHVHVVLEKLALRTRLEIAAFALRGPTFPHAK